MNSEESWSSCCIPYQLRQTLCRPGPSSPSMFSVHPGCSLSIEVHILHVLGSIWHCETIARSFSQDGQVHSTSCSLQSPAPPQLRQRVPGLKRGVLKTVTHQGPAWVWCLEAQCVGQSGNLLCNQRASQCCLPAGSHYVANAILYLRKSAHNSRGYRNTDANFIINYKKFLQRPTHGSSLLYTSPNIQGKPTVCLVEKAQTG